MIFLKKRLVSAVLAVFTVCANIRCYALEVSAVSAIAVDALSGDVIYEKNAHQRLPMASTTKIMTALCAIENGDMDDIVKVHPSSVGVEGSSMYLGHDEEISLLNLIYGLMLSSGNDAAVAIAMHISGSVESFAQLMNDTAKRIGANNTNFKNPNGLDDKDHFTTAYDLALITRYALKNPDFAEIVATENKKIPWQGREYDRNLKNHNKLLRMYEGCNGVKTGFTKKSGRCLVSGARREGFNVVAVTLNAPDDWRDHIRMLDYAFDRYENNQFLKAGEYLRSVNVSDGVSDKVRAVAETDFFVPGKNGVLPDVEVRYEIDDNTEAPVEYGRPLGKVIFLKNGAVIGEVNAISSETCARVERKSFLSSIKKIFTRFVFMYRRTC